MPIHLRLVLASLGVTLGVSAGAACSSASSKSTPATSRDAGSDASGTDTGAFALGDGSTTWTPAPIYAHSPFLLYSLEPTTTTLALVGPFKGCTNVIDLAINATNDAYVTTYTGFYKLDLQTATCTLVANGMYPNSLSFVPKGTLDPDVEALVGYFGAEYVRIDLTSGAVTMVGMLTGDFQSSGDIVSVVGGGTFLTAQTVTSTLCGDCLLQVDPTTGDLIQNYGSVGRASVFGIAFWAGIVYGFDDEAQVFSIGYANNQIQTSAIPVPNPPAGLRFWGAGSTTVAPPSGDGGIPVK